MQYILNDCHLHLVDFLQETDGAEAALREMDRAGVDQAVIFGMSIIKKWDAVSPDKPKYYLSDDARCYWYSMTDTIVATELHKLNQKDRQRFHPFICGFNPTDLNAIDHIRRMVKYHPNFWRGIGEVFSRHDDLTALIADETSRANHKAMDPVYEFAAEYDLPISLHSNISSVIDRSPIYLFELEEALKKHPLTKIIWCHCGLSRRIEVHHLVSHLKRVLLAYPNLYMDLSWVAYDLSLVNNGKVKPEWVSLLNQFSDRFLIGSDEIGHFAKYTETMHRYYIVLDALEPDCAQRIAQTNFINLLPKNLL